MAWHAKLSASTAKRWINCPGSVAKIESLPASFKGGSSTYAEEGTAAHALLEHCLRPYQETRFEDVPLNPHELVGGLISPEHAVFPPASVTPQMVATAKENKHWFDVTEDMAEAVQVCIDEVLEQVERLGAGVTLYLERQWDMTWLHPDLGGTSDVTLDQFLEELVVIDYKHGKGVVVEVDDNEQLMNYLLGAAKGTDFTHERYTIVVCQPRAAHQDGSCRSQTFTRAELLAFRDVVADAAADTQRKGAPLKCGEWCRFCPAAPACEELAKGVTAACAADFEDEPLPLDVIQPDASAQMVANALSWLPMVEAWCKQTKAVALMVALNGTPVPGRKIVQSKTNRKVLADEETFAAQFVAAGLNAGKLWTDPKLKTPAQIEKLGKDYKAVVKTLSRDTTVGDQTFPAMVGKPPGRPTLALESDPRPAVDVGALAALDFKDEDDSTVDTEEY